MEKKYPDAEEKRKYYGGIYSNLHTLSGNIKSSLANVDAYIINNMLLESTELQGEFYDIYVSKKNEFVEEVVIYRDKLTVFYDELQVCMIKAQVLRDLWWFRESVYEEE